MEVIYDFETLSQNAFNGVVLSVAGIAYEEERFLTNPYTYEEYVTALGKRVSYQHTTDLLVVCYAYAICICKYIKCELKWLKNLKT